jgi:uncharacterized membrane protein
MRRIGIGQIVFAASMMLAGALSIAFHDFALVFGEVPKTIAGHDALAMASGAILLLGGAALLVPRTARIAAFVLTILLLLFTLLCHVRPVVMHPLVEGSWYALGETLALAAGAWIVFSMQPARGGGSLANFGSVRAGQIVFGLCLIPLGLSHMFYMNLTAPLIPSYLPFHVPLGYATGAFHIAAGLGILFGVVPWLAATLETVMVSLFTLLIWVPAVLGTPKPFDWTEFCASLAITGAAWVVADSFRAPNKFARRR